MCKNYQLLLCKFSSLRAGSSSKRGQAERRELEADTKSTIVPLGTRAISQG